ncbi:glycosyltransferase family 4 protein [Candidatus Dependentiae bacterium]
MAESRKKILYVHHGKGIGGAPISLLQMACGLDKKKYDPVVLFLHNSDAVDLFKDRGVKVLGPVGRYDFSHTKIWWYRWYHIHHILRALWDSFFLWFWDAKNWIKKVKPDIIHLNTSTLLVWGVVAKKMRIPVVWHVREPLSKGYFGFRRWLVKKVVGKYSDIILPICKNDALPWKDLSKTKVLYNAVDLKKFDSKMRKKTETPTILFLGGLSKEKGTHIILRVFEKLLLKLPEAILKVAGYWGVEEKCNFFLSSPSEKFKETLEKLVLPVKKSVEFLGPIKNVPEEMSQSTCLVFPATVGHFARPVIEAGCMGVPVVASNLPPLDELVIDGKTGFLVTPDDIESWVEKLAKICMSERLRLKMGLEAKIFCCGKFGLEKQVKMLEEIYENLIQSA